MAWGISVKYPHKSPMKSFKALMKKKLIIKVVPMARRKIHS